MSLTKNIGIGKERFDFRYGIDLSTYHYMPDIRKDWESKGIWPTDEEVEETTDDAGAFNIISYLDYSSDGLAIRVQYHIKSFGQYVNRYLTLLIVREHRISVNKNASKYVERLKYYGYEIAFRDEQGNYTLYGPRK